MSVAWQPSRSLMVFIDGENIVKRFQATIDQKPPSQKYTSKIKHIPDKFVWHHQWTQFHAWAILRASYYTYALGGLEGAEQLAAQIKTNSFMQHASLPNKLTPCVLHKKAKEKTPKGVDIRLTVDMLSHCYKDHVDGVWLFSGDGDYVPLLEEVKRTGKTVFVSAFSSGLSPKIEAIADEFFDLDWSMWD